MFLLWRGGCGDSAAIWELAADGGAAKALLPPLISRATLRRSFKGQQLQANLGHFFSKSLFNLGLSAELAFQSNQPGDQAVFSFSAESSNFRIQSRSVVHIVLLV